MKVILTENVPHVGKIGEIVNVKNGYGRNYLIPKKLAALADDGHKRQLNDQLKRLAKKIAAEKELANAVKNKLSNVVLQFIKKVGSNGKLFGSVTTSEISRKLQEDHEVLVENKLLVLSSPVRKLGVYDVRARLFPEIEANFKVKVVADPESFPKEEEAPKKGRKPKAKKEDAADKVDAKETSTDTAEKEEKDDEKKVVAKPKKAAATSKKSDDKPKKKTVAKKGTKKE